MFHTRPRRAGIAACAILTFGAHACSSDSDSAHSDTPASRSTTAVTSTSTSSAPVSTEPALAGDVVGVGESWIVFSAQLEAGGDEVLAAADLDGSNLEPATSDGYHHGRHPRIRPGS